MTEALEHTTGTFDGRGGLRLYCQRWVPASAWTTLVVVHGGGEHSGRYAQTAQVLNREGIAVHAFDLRGHGRSPGIRGHVGRFNEHLGDLAAFLRSVREPSSAGVPVLFGHSLGGLIAARFAAEQPGTVRGLICSSPLWGLALTVPWWKHALAYALSPVWPSLTLNRPKIDAEALSHDPDAQAEYLNDPLIHTKASLRFYVELRRQFARLPACVRQLRLPVLVLQAGADCVVSVEATKTTFAAIGAMQKRLILYDGYCHELLQEVGREAVLRDLIDWLRSLAGGTGAAGPREVRR